MCLAYSVYSMSHVFCNSMSSSSFTDGFIVRCGDGWSMGKLAHFPSLPQVLECKFESSLKLDFSDLSM